MAKRGRMSLATAVSMILDDSQEYESSGASENEDGGQEEQNETGDFGLFLNDNVSDNRYPETTAMDSQGNQLYKNVWFISLGCIIKELQYLKVF